MNTSEKFHAFLECPLGMLKVTWNESGLVTIDFVEQVNDGPYPSVAALPPLVSLLGEELAAYFSGKLRLFSVPLALEGGTSFQRRVWQALREIPYGKTVTYGELARSLGLSAGASRAVGSACGANPLPIVIPCHRVVTANGGLGGYSGGLWRKEQLLALEQG